jgi:hypothetical protein
VAAAAAAAAVAAAVLGRAKQRVVVGCTLAEILW